MGEMLHILAVDDNAANLTTIEQELGLKYQVTTILTGRRALKFLYQTSVDLILLDVEMPIMDGIETLEQIRTLEHGKGATVPVIFLTGNKDKQTVIEGAKLGIMDYITKPFDTHDLSERIEQVFVRLGKVPATTSILKKVCGEALEAIQESREKVLLSKLEEMESYQIDEDLHERIRHAKLKLVDGETDTCLKMLERLYQILDQQSKNISNSDLRPMTPEEMRTHLNLVLYELLDFNIKQAQDDMNLLNERRIPDHYLPDVNQVMQLLSDYNDIDAENKLKELIEKIEVAL